MLETIKTIKLNMIGDYVKIKNNDLFFSISSFHQKIAAQEIKKHHHVHVFISSTIDIIDDLENFLNCIPYDVPVYIHVPKHTIDNVIIINDVFYKMDSYPRAKILVEKTGPSFAFDKLSSSSKYLFKVNYNDDKITTCIELNQYRIEYKYSSDGAIKTIAMSVEPELFKDKIIENFKSECPNGILSSFKNDDDIWDYIMMNGEWKISKSGEENK